jgi:predicted porin
MKKSLFALAAVTAFAGAAQAQSSVTVYGILDIGYVGGNERAASSAGVNQLTYNTIGQSAQSTSRLGFRGTEDLGGGTRAFFTLETAITPSAASFSNLQTRAAFVGLSQKGIGSATIGTQNTVVTDAISPTIVGQFNNIAGSMIFGTRTGPSTVSGGSFGTTAVAAGSNGNSNQFTFRTGSTLKLQSERMAGFQLGAMAVLNDANRNQNGTFTSTAGGKDNQQGWGLGANYQWKKLVVTAAYQSFKAYDNNSSSLAIWDVAGQSSSGTIGQYNGTNVKDDQMYAGAMYDFGVLKAYASYINRKVTSQINSNQFAKRSGQEIGVRGNLTPKIESWASMGNGSFQTFGTGEPTANLVGWQLGSNYILSKRTNLYAIYGYSATSNASGRNNNYNNNNYAVGMRHTF